MSTVTLYEVMASALVPATVIAYAVGRRHEQILRARAAKRYTTRTASWSNEDGTVAGGASWCEPVDESAFSRWLRDHPDRPHRDDPPFLGPPR